MSERPSTRPTSGVPGRSAAPAATADLRRTRLAAQRLSSPAADPRAAARAVAGVQAQDPRAASLALRARVDGLEPTDVDEGLVRTWAWRATAHLIDVEDRPWIAQLTGERLATRFAELLRSRGVDDPEAMLATLRGELGPIPRLRRELLSALTPLPDRVENLVLAYACVRGVAAGTADGRFLAIEPPAPVDPDEALATLGARYRAGYGPDVTAEDLAKFSGLPLTRARRALEAAPAPDSGPEPSDPPPVKLLGAFDPLLLGYADRALWLGGADDRELLPGGGMLKAAVLVDGVATGTWTLGRDRRPEVRWFGAPGDPAELEREADDVARFLGTS